MRLKKTDYVIISILLVVVIAGIVGLVIANNLMKENDERDRQRRNNVTSDLNVVAQNETNIVNSIDTNTTPIEQMQQLVNELPTALQTQNDQSEIKSIKIRYAYGYDVALADEQKFIDVLEIDCKDDELKNLAQLITNNKLDASETAAQTSATTYYNTQIVINGNKVVSFSDKNATYKRDDKSTAVVLTDELLTKTGEIVNRELSKHVYTIDASTIKSAVITNSNNASVTVTDTEEIKAICTLASCVNLKTGVVDLTKSKVTYTVELNNGIKMKITSGGAEGYVMNGSNQQEVKFMFNVEQGLETIFKKYAK